MTYLHYLHSNFMRKILSKTVRQLTVKHMQEVRHFCETVRLNMQEVRNFSETVRLKMQEVRHLCETVRLNMQEVRYLSF